MSAAHDHERDHVDSGSLRPKAARLEDPESALPMRAALSGRLDAVTPPGVLGLQRAAGNAGTAALLEEERSPVHDVISGPGEPLAHDVWEDMESSLGHNFHDLRVHSDGAADASARSVNANAYTVGSHVVFQRSAFDPGSHEGRTALTHELTHVVRDEPAVGGDRVELGREPVLRSPPVVHHQGTNVMSPAVTSMLQLQRTAGNAAVAGLLAAQPTVQRAPVKRRGEKWDYGPITSRKSAQHDLMTYLHWVKEVERAYGKDKQVVLQRLRRLYYSTYSGAAGANFDRVIAEQAGAGDEPLDTIRISTQAIDGLYETDSLRTPTGETVDPAHVLAALDVKTAGITFKASAAEALYDVKWTGVVTWAGDLASWFVEWIKQRRKLDETPSTEPATDAGPPEETGGLSPSDIKLLDTLAASKAAKEDLLGDMDAQVMAEEHVRPSTIEHIKEEGRIIRNANIATELDMPVSKILEQYYGIGMGTAKPTQSQQRFPTFVRKATPPIPHKATGTSGTNGSVVLASDAEKAIYTAVFNTAFMFIKQGTSDKSDPLTRYDLVVREIARRFTRFLEIGLKAGDAPWP